MDCICPRPAALTTVLRVTCPENLGQIQRFIFQRAGFVFDAAADPTPNDILELDSWTPLITAVAGTKIVITPYVDTFTIPEAEAITKGGNDNTTLNGVKQLLGFGGINPLGKFTGIPTAIVTQLRDLMCEGELVVYLINAAGRIVANKISTGVYTGLTVEPLTMGINYPGSLGFATLDQATIQWGFAEDWAKNRAILTPNFNVKTQLLAPAA
jgi:hypothetical protein